MTAHDSYPSSLLRENNIALVVADMDGTLLDDNHEIPPSLWPILSQLHDRGIAFAPASGRQYATLHMQFDAAPQHAPDCFIAENGTNVVRNNETVSSTTIPAETVTRVIAHLHRLRAAGLDLGVVLCTPTIAYVERSDEAFLSQTRRYYASLQHIDDLSTVDPTSVIKIAIFGFDPVETEIYPHLTQFTNSTKVAISGEHWIDIMHLDADKGTGLRQLCTSLGISSHQVLAFGDYLNDLELLDVAGCSFAMSNAHPRIRAIADYIAPANTEEGVITVLTRLLADGDNPRTP